MQPATIHIYADHLNSSPAENRAPARLRDIHTQVAVIGGGIAGIWAALKLVSRGIPTVLVTYTAKDRGGIQGSTVKSVGAINTTPLTEKDFPKQLDEMTRGQANTSIAKSLAERLGSEIQALRQYSELEDIKLGVRLARGDSRRLLARLYSEFARQGGIIVNGWVTRIVADSDECRGLQYQSQQGIGKLRSKFIVIASGGYAGLFDGSVQTASYGTVLGQFLQSGGGAVNLEFLFKHGYGKPDMGQLTPTEELRGAEIRDDDGNHVSWLERELFNGNGTRNHQSALRFWRDNRSKRFYVTLRHRPLYLQVQRLNQLLGDGIPHRRKALPLVRQRLKAVLKYVAPDVRRSLRRKIVARLRAGQAVDYDLYCAMRRSCDGLNAEQRQTPIRQIAYFTMGGIAHREFQTNLCNVYVTGEAMHDFGANRVGGLPWGLYLVAGGMIAEQIAASCDRTPGNDSLAPDFELLDDDAVFDATMLQKLRSLLYEHQEKSFSAEQASRAISWLQSTRRRFVRAGSPLNDAISWLVVAEAIFQASLARRESRGCFMRDDYVDENEDLRDVYTYCYYDDAADEVICQLVTKAELEGFFARRGQKERCCG